MALSPPLLPQVAPAKSSALSSSCPRSCHCPQSIPPPVRCRLSPCVAERVTSPCSVGCCLSLRLPCWPASLAAPGRARRSQAAARAGWESLPRTASSSCPSATAGIAPRLCASSCGYVPFGPSVHPSMWNGELSRGKEHFQEQWGQEQPWCKGWLVWGGWEALGLAVGMGRCWRPEKGLGMVSLVPGGGDLSTITFELNCRLPDALQSSRRYS